MPPTEYTLPRGRMRDWAIGLTLLLGLVIWVQTKIGWGTLLAPWLEIAPIEIAGLFLLSLFSYLCRAFRLMVYFPELLGTARLTTIRLSLLHNLANNLLPMRLGEAAFPLLMKRYFGHGYSASTFSLLWIRLLDLHVLVLLALAATWLATPHWLWPLAATGLLLALPLLQMLRLPLRQRLARHDGRLAALADSALASMPDSGQRLAWVYLWTLGTWVTKFIAFTTLLLAFVDMHAWQAIAGVLGAELSSLLPLHGIAGSGSYELAAVAALVPLGVSAEDALRGAVNVHIFLLGVTLALGPLGLLLPRRTPPAH